MDTPGRPSAAAIRVRDARPGEHDAISSLLAEVYGAFRPHFPAGAWTSYLGEIVDVRSRAADSELIVALSDDSLVGAVGFYSDAARATLERWPAGWASIRTVAVIGDARGRGAGEALARECLRRAQVHGARAVGLHTASFMTAATRLYKRLGFRRAPDFDIEIGEMFTGRSLPPDASWQAQAYRIDLEGL